MDICSENELHFCRLCDFVTENNINLEEHKETNGSCFKFSCNDCEFKSSLFSNLEEHNEKSHKDGENIKPSTIIHSNFFFKCPKCDFVGSKKNILEKHQSLDACYSFKCYLCDFKTSLKDSLTQHHKGEHPSKKRYKCPNCDFETDKRFKFEKHLKNYECEKYVCSTCEFKTSYQYKFNLHLKEHAPVQVFLKQEVLEQIVSQKKEPSRKHKIACQACDYEVAPKLEKSLKIHIENKICYKFFCSICEFKTSLKQKLTLHYLAEHKDVYEPKKLTKKKVKSKKPKKVKVEVKERRLIHKCPDCDFEHIHRYKLQKHLNRKRCFIFVCNTCDFKTSLLKKLSEHHKEHPKVVKKDLQEKKTTKDKFQCDNCDYMVYKRARIRNHIKEQKCFRFSCSCCDFKTSLQWKLTSHYMEEHKEKYVPRKLTAKKKKPNGVDIDRIRHTCQNCDYSTVTRLKYEAHLLGGENSCYRFKCERCPFTSSLQSKFTDHRQTFHFDDLKYKCDECKFASDHRIVVLRHKERLHNGEIHQCNLCSYNSMVLYEYTHHMKYVHKNSEFSKNVKEETQQYPCHICDSVLGGKYNMRMHMFSHKVLKTDEGYSCSDCKISSEEHATIRKHVELHFKIEYMCKECSTKFTRLDTFRIHLKTKHNDEKKMIVCPRCKYATKRKDAMKRHVLQVHFRIREKCDFCIYTSFEKRFIRQHMEKKHPKLYETSSYFKKTVKTDNRIYY